MKITKNEFLNYMEEIDDELRKEDRPYHQRPSHAFARLADRIDKKGTFVMRSSDEIAEDDYSNDALYEQVNRWYEKRYGERIKIHLGPGSYVLIIKNEPWEVVYPYTCGLIKFYINEDINKSERYYLHGGHKIPEVNILWNVKDITYEIASKLNDEEKIEILKEYMFGFYAVEALKNFTGDEYMEKAKNDYDVAIYNIFTKYPDYNNSKWASLQLAEKTIKSKLKASGISFRYNHDLFGLVEKIEDVGIKIPKEIINNIQCSAGVRYGEFIVKRMEAVKAIRSALKLFSIVYKEKI